MQKNVPADIRKDGIFVEMLTRALLVADRRGGPEVPSPSTFREVAWACQGGVHLQTGCLWGAFLFFAGQGSESCMHILYCLSCYLFACCFALMQRQRR